MAEGEHGGTEKRRGFAGPAVLLGAGLGGFLDGIVLHQLLQWHHLISSTQRGDLDTVAGLKANTLADGLFHAAMWVVSAGGLWWLWRSLSRQRTTLDRQFFGWLLVGWGAFNVLDEALFHALLDLHHIREGDNELVYDMAFLVAGVALIAAGSLLARSRDPVHS